MDEIITHLSLSFVWKWNLVDDCIVMVHYEQGVFFSNNNFCHFIALQKKKKKKLESKGKGRKLKGGRRRKKKRKNVAESLRKGKKQKNRDTEEEHKMKKNPEVKNSFTVRDTWPCKRKLDEKNSKHACLALHNGFGPAFFHKM